jgi:hypothetical protein
MRGDMKKDLDAFHSLNSGFPATEMDRYEGIEVDFQEDD